MDLTAVLERDDTEYYISLLPGIDHDVAEKFHCGFGWRKLVAQCSDFETRNYKTLHDVNNIVSGLFLPKLVFRKIDGTIYGN